MRLPPFSRLLLLVVFGGLLSAPSLPAEVLTGELDIIDIYPGENPTAVSLTSQYVTLLPGATLTMGTGAYNSSRIDEMYLWSNTALTLNAHTVLQIGYAHVMDDNVSISLAPTSSATRTILDAGGNFSFHGANAAVTVNSRSTFNALSLYLGYAGFNDAVNNQIVVTGANALLQVGSDLVVGWSTIDTNEQLHRGGGTLTVQSGASVTTAGLILGRNGSSNGTLNIGAYDLTNPTTAGTVTSSSVTFAGGDGVINFNQTNATTFSAPISGAGQIVQRGAGTTTLTGNNTYVGSTTVSGGTLKLGAAGALSGGAALSLASGGTLDLNGYAASVGALTGASGSSIALTGASLAVAQATNTTFAGSLTGTGGLTKSGSGTLTLSGTNPFSGDTAITGGTLKLAGSAANSAFTVSGGGSLSGTGTVGSLTLASGGVLAPGNSPGTLGAGSTTFGPGGSFQFEVNNATGAAGTGYDLLAITGSLNIAATSANPFTLDVVSLTSGNASGLADNFSAAANYSFTFVTTTTGITGFAANKFTVNTSGFTNPFSGTWAVAQSGNNLALNYTGVTAVPEPSTYALLTGLVMFAVVAIRRR